MAEQRQYTEQEAEQILRLAARKGTGEISRDRLMQMADELGISPSEVAQAETEYLARRSEAEDWQAHRAQALRELREHAVIYLVVNGGLLALDVVKDGRLDWAVWSIFGWGIGLVSHVVSVQFAGPASGEREYRRWRAHRESLPATETLDRALDEISAEFPGQKLMAIRELRHRFGLGLREAADVVEGYAARHPHAFRI